MDFKRRVIFLPAPELDSLAITVLPTDTHEYVLTNRKSIHWSSETNKMETRKWHGLVMNRWTSITNFWLDTTSKTTDKNVIKTSVFPHKVETTFSKEEGQFLESMFLVRNQEVMIIQYQSDFSANVHFRIQFAMRRDWEAEAEKPTSSYNSKDGILYISMQNPSYEGPKYLAISSSTETSFLKNARRLGRVYPRDHSRGDGHDDESIVEVGSLSFRIKKEEPVVITIGLDEKLNDVQKHTSKQVYLEWWNQTINPLKLILDNNKIVMPSKRWVHALQWAILSLDSLSMNVKGEGIYAGLHWFPEYWGRDSFISFRGALLSSGNSDMGREWIRTMVKFQDKDSTSYTYGRVPNILQVDTPHPNYETADGTGWYIRAIWDFFQIFGLDRSFLSEIWSSVVIAILGEISRTDSEGLLTHEPRGTWMDAQTENIIATPRGNRAVEIQILFYVTLDIGRRLANLVNDEELSKKWNERMVALKETIISKFWNLQDKSLFDHLNEDGSVDYQKRPNAIFALTLPLPDNPILNFEQEKLVLEDVTKNCLAPHGIRSLSPHDPAYHPLHDYGSKKGKEHHDFSYHNGDVWLWLSGAVIESTLRHGHYKIASQLTTVLTERILTRDGLGTLAEIMDGSTDDNLGNSRGTISQAWSLAEYIRTFYSSWIGITSNALDRNLRVSPVILQELESSEIILPFGEGRISIEYRKLSYSQIKIFFIMYDFKKPISLQIRLYHHQTEKTPYLVDGTDKVSFTRRKNDYILQLDEYLYENRNLTIEFQ